MKKIVLLLGCLLLCFVSGCSNQKIQGYNELTFEEFNQKKENGDTFPLVIGSETCSACATYKVVMKQFIEDYQVEVFYIDLSSLDDNQYNELITEISFSGTPTTVFYENGNLTSFFNRIDKAVSIDKVVEKFKENNYIR